MEKICLLCGNIFIKKQNESQKYWINRRYCSKECGNKSRIGKPNNSSGCFKKGQKSLTKGIKLSEDRILKQKEVMSNFWKSEKGIIAKEKIRQSLLGRPTGRTGEKSNFWKGGKTYWRDKLENSIEYKTWRRKVFERDNYKCQECGDSNYEGRGKTIELQAHHIKPVYKFPNLATEVSNGITLCRDCHRATDSWGRQKGSINK